MCGERGSDRAEQLGRFRFDRVLCWRILLRFVKLPVLTCFCDTLSPRTLIARHPCRAIVAAGLAAGSVRCYTERSAMDGLSCLVVGHSVDGCRRSAGWAHGPVKAVGRIAWSETGSPLSGKV